MTAKVNFCSDWCNNAGFWTCGINILPKHDPLNSDGNNYVCDCHGCNGCPNACSQGYTYYDGFVEETHDPNNIITGVEDMDSCTEACDAKPTCSSLAFSYQKQTCYLHH